MTFMKTIMVAPLTMALSLLLVGVLTPVMTPAASAQTASAKTVVDQAKRDGLVGERIDGYLGVVGAGLSAPIQAAVNEINIRRKSAYTKLARQQNVSVEVVAALSGEKLAAKALAGTKTMDASGAWSTVGG